MPFLAATLRVFAARPLISKAQCNALVRRSIARLVPPLVLEQERVVVVQRVVSRAALPRAILAARLKVNTARSKSSLRDWLCLRQLFLVYEQVFAMAGIYQESCEVFYGSGL